MKNAIIAIIAVIVLIAAGFYFFRSGTKNSPSADENKNQNAATVSENIVSMKSLSYSPVILTIKAGDEVTWTNNDTVTHTVTMDDGSTDSGEISPDESFKQTFDTAGTYSYHCSIHPTMKAKIIVQ